MQDYFELSLLFIITTVPPMALYSTLEQKVGLCPDRPEEGFEMKKERGNPADGQGHGSRHKGQ